MRQLFLLPHQLLLLQEALELLFSPEFLIRRNDAVSNSVSNVLTGQTSNISTAILERVEDTVSNSVSGFLGVRPIVALTKRRSGKQYYSADNDKLASRIAGPRSSHWQAANLGLLTARPARFQFGRRGFNTLS